MGNEGEKDMTDSLYIVMPAYNEEENIEATVKQWHPVIEKTGEGSKLIVFNDGSKDNTYDILLSLKDKYPLLIPVDKPNSGHGPTCIYAYDYCIENKVPYIFQTDSDGQTEPEEFWRFWEDRKKYDFIIGYRNNRQDGFSRIIVTKVLKFLVWLVFRESVTDCNTPFRLMNTEKLKPLLDYVPKDFFLSNVIISMLIVKRRERHLWVPITFKPRQGGVCSVNLKRTFQIGVQAIRDFREIKKRIKNMG